MTHDKVGILLVHGIGEQLEQGHLVGEASNIVLALEAALKADAKKNKGRQFTIGVAHHRRDPKRDLEARDPDAPLVVTVRWFDLKGGLLETKEFHFREAFWADLGEPATLMNNLKFWFWAFSMWAVRSMPFQGNKSEGRRKFMQSAKANSNILSASVRLQLLATAIVFMPIVAGLVLIGTLSKKLGFGGIRPLDFLVAYMSDIKLYQAAHWSGGNRMPDIDQPPRIAIRRRMVRTLVDMALDGHDRWYVVAHSLGTVVALNGLMETKHCLPNHLDEERWKLCKQKIDAEDNSLSGTEYVMHPRRPAWLQPRDVIARDMLFKKMRMLLTYGSPLDKFATLFPQVVPLNTEGLPRSATWINIYDPLDPVAGHLDAFEQAFAPGSGPVNRAHRAHWLLLLNHTLYLKHRPKPADLGPDDLKPVDWVADVMLTDTGGREAIAAPDGTFGLRNRGRCYDRFFGVIRAAEWTVVWMLFVFVVRYLWGVLGDYEKWGQQKGFSGTLGYFADHAVSAFHAMPLWMYWAAVLGALAALVAGILRIGYELLNDDQENRAPLKEAAQSMRSAKLLGPVDPTAQHVERGSVIQPVALLVAATVAAAWLFWKIW